MTNPSHPLSRISTSFLILLPATGDPPGYHPMPHRVDGGWLAGGWRVERAWIKSTSIYYCDTHDKMNAYVLVMLLLMKRVNDAWVLTTNEHE